MEILSILMIGVGLSMDAFSLSLGYGVLSLKKTNQRIVALTVGLFHFFMPLLGMSFGDIIEHLFLIDLRYIVFTIFMILGIEMAYSTIEKDKGFVFLNGIIGLILFSFTVSIDSFSAGVGIKFISNKYLLCCFVFSLTSAIFTYLGLKIGALIGKKHEDTSKLIGALIFVVFSLYYLFK
ncbi:MAG: manganese efflux pump [Bacilli bacterium]|nr:manganese efflux pump [Bacilli bacterium]MDD3305306.1 manganese efflux pump [Bacilli bacterium]MDD4053310.1 manganese efflux pump [Bacilli bacterium]MDD4411349.1 manganese efflux pump [Bacilli bacterium]